MSVTYNLKGLRALQKKIPSFTRKMQLKIAKKAPEKIIENVMLKKAGIFPNKSLPKNEASTVKAKGHDVVLVGKEKKLLRANRWRYKRAGGRYEVLPPKDRTDVVGYLQSGVRAKKRVKRYPIMLLPKKYMPVWVKETIKAEFNRFMQKYK